MSATVAAQPTAGSGRRGWIWLTAVLVAIVAVAGLSVYLTAPRSGGTMDPHSTQPNGAHALVTLLREHGVEVVVADTVADVERNARPDTLLLAAELWRISDELTRRLSELPGDLLLVAPTYYGRLALAPEITQKAKSLSAGFERDPGCDLPAATRAGSVDFHSTQAYQGVGDQPVDSCYGGALVRYRAGHRTVTVIGSDFPFVDVGLATEGNAALAMNLAGERPRLIWYAPQRLEGDKRGTDSIFDLMPDNVSWLVWQLCLAVALAALWRGRRIGPLVAERLPVVVRASETVEGRGRLYRSRRARDRAAQALRTATLQRILPRLGLNTSAPPTAIVTAVSTVSAAPQSSGFHPESVWHTLFGQPPDSDAELLQLARTLDQIERQVLQT